MFRLAHLSDPHVPPLQAPRRRELLSQRALGWTNWQRNRRFVHRQDVLDAVTEDIARRAPDHIAVTGDLTIVSSRAEWEGCLQWLDTLGGPADVSLVPGNHDAYTRRSSQATLRVWREYMSGDDAAGERESAEFPYLRRRGPLAIVGCSSAVPTAPFLATGRAGETQIARTRALLSHATRLGLFRVVLIHHPPTRELGDRYRRLTDAREFAAMLAQAGAELVLHGHEHLATLRWLPGPLGAIPVVGVPSASAIAHGSRPAAEYNICEVEGDPGSWTCAIRTLGFESERIRERSRRLLWRDGVSLDSLP